MEKVRAKYTGGLRVEATHVRSGATLLTDAPVDNHGQGRSFSPTDLLCTAAAACMLTIMGVAAEAHGFSIEGVTVEGTKEMGTEPRRITKLTFEDSRAQRDDVPCDAEFESFDGEGGSVRL